MGTTSARITASSTDTSTAFVSCGPDFCRVRCSVKNPAILDIDSIWFTKRIHPGYMHSPITAICQLPHAEDFNAVGRHLGGLLFTASGDQLLFSQLDSEARVSTQDIAAPHQNDCRAVPRKLLTGAKPTNVTYLEPTRKLAIATMEAKEEQAPPQAYRVLHSAIKLLETAEDKALDEPDIKEENENNPMSKAVAATYELNHGERVYSIAEWPYTDNRGKKYDLLIVGTGVPDIMGKEMGRRLIINPGKTGSKLQLQKGSIFGDPVYCTAVYGNLTSVSAIGKTLTFDVFEPQAGL